ncbi:MAG: type II toxin-antitoxin system HigB family toxin, partial [Bacteroidetes bacterium]|nr:type II toxin-antitoxin system HigB family toxin [Bacteroidota bacterium]
MKNIVSGKMIREFWEKYPDSDETLKTWYKVAMKADWRNSIDVKTLYRNASVVGDSRIVLL